MFCKKCGKEMDEGMTFCPFCGQEQTESTAENTEKKQENISNKQLIIAGVIMAAVILAVIEVFKLLGREPEKDVAADISAETEENLEEQQTENPKEEIVESAESETEKEIEETAETSEAAEPETAETPQISHIVTDEYEYWFDEDGDLIRVKEDMGVVDIQYLTDSMGNKIEGKISERLIDMMLEKGITDNLITYEELFYLEGHLIESVSGVFDNGVDLFLTNTYDGENIMTSQYTEVGGNDYNRNLSFQYETDCILVSEYETWYETLGEDKRSSMFRSSMFTCSFDGNKMVECVCESDGDYRCSTYSTWEYDGNGKLLSEKVDYDYGTFKDSRTNDFIYDGKKNLIRHKSTYKTEVEGVESINSVTISEYQYQYDKDGNVVKTEEQEISTEKGTKVSESYSTGDSQYDENGNKVHLSASNKSFDYDETGAVEKQRTDDLNYIWEYDAEGKVIYSSYLISSTGNDIGEWKEEYLYDEQGRLIEIRTDGETAVEISYTDEGLFKQSNVLKDNVSRSRPENLISNLIPEDGKVAMKTFWDNSNNIVIEYRRNK